MENADIILRKLHNNEIDDVPIEEGNIIFDKDTKQMLVDDEDNGVGKRLKYGGSEKLIDVILTANTTTKTVYDDTITTDSIIRIYVDEEDSSFTYNSLSTSNGSVTITFNAMTQDVPIKVGIGAVSEFHQLITEGQASDISYNNSQSGMTATDVQEAIDELKSDLGNIELTADNVEYDNTTSGLQATNVQDAVDEITDNLAGFKFYPSGTSIVGLISDDSAYTDSDGRYVIWGTPTAEQLVEDNPNTYKSVPSTEDCRGKVGADTASPFKANGIDGNECEVLFSLYRKAYEQKTYTFSSKCYALVCYGPTDFLPDTYPTLSNDIEIIWNNINDASFANASNTKFRYMVIKANVGSTVKLGNLSNWGGGQITKLINL